MINKNLLIASFAVLVLVSSAAAEITNLTLYPIANTVGDNTTFAPGFDGSAWQAGGTSTKAELYLPTSVLFTNPVKISDIASISYWTNKPGDVTKVDWSLLLYTNKTNSGDAGSFYHNRLNAEPYQTGTPSGSDLPGTWHQWSSDGSSALQFYDYNRNGNNYNFGTSLSNITSGPVTWGNGQTVDYRDETLKFVSLQTGSDWSNGFTGDLDGLTITLKDGSTANVNFEATPEPGTFVLLGTGLIGGFFVRRRALRQ